MKYYYLLLFSFLFSSGYSQTITATIGYQGYDESQPYFGEGEYEIFPDVVDGVLDKPIILIDGFDPGNSTAISDLYTALDFSGGNLGDIMRNEGYDLVALNFPEYTTDGNDIDGGADYIQRNAMVLIELISFINSQKVGNEELVIIGPSMGGLIARYGLSYMEQNSLDHETRLYISFDSPHLGANVPISFQYLLNYLGEDVGNVDAQAVVANVLNSPAAKEMLIDHYSSHLLAGSTFEQDPAKLLPAGAPDFRDAFQAELDALGFPADVRNVSMINGSGNSTTTGTPGMQVINTTLNLSALITADVVMHFTPEASQAIGVTDFQSFLIGVPAGSFMADAESGATSDGLDSTPGGTSTFSGSVGPLGGNPIIAAFLADLDQDTFSFIPTLSALAIDNEDDWYASVDLGGVHTSPFVNTFIPTVNEDHVTLTAANVAFALEEIRDGALSTIENDISNRFLLIENPTDDLLKIQLNASHGYQDVTLSIYNVVGQQLFEEKIHTPSERIELQHGLKAGLYLLKINEAGQAATIRFIVK